MQENPQENNNFETIISKWRRLSGELIESPVFVRFLSFFKSMSGDSSSHQPFKKKEEDSNLLVIDRPKGPIATAASAGGTVALTLDENSPAQGNADPTSTEDKPEKTETGKPEKEEGKEAAGDASFPDEKKELFGYLDNDTESGKGYEKSVNEKGDKVDSVYLRPPPPHKARSNTSTANEDEDCGIKCLYYTLQCCDCVLM